MCACLKCGKETKEKNAFCPDCLAIMDTYPVKPGSVALLLPRPRRAERKQHQSYQEAAMKARLYSMRITVRWLIVLTVLLSVLLLATAGLLIHSTLDTPETPAIGRNYTTTQQP